MKVLSRQNTCVNEREASGAVRLQGGEVETVHELVYIGSTFRSNRE